MKETILDVLMYLFENYLDEDQLFQQDQDELKHELHAAGFHHSPVNSAFEWLESLALQQEQSDNAISDERCLPVRIYTATEVNKLGMEGRSFLLFLEHVGVLDLFSREIIIDRCMALDSDDFSLDHLKWVALMVLFNQPGQESAYTWMEDLVYKNLPTYFH
jgi:Smg protein